jgi:hypothetical protein
VAGFLLSGETMKKLLSAVVLVCLFHAGLFAQNNGALTPWATPTFPNASGSGPDANGFICTYAAGTTTPLSPFSNPALSAAHHNPIQLNAAGRPVTWAGSSELSIYLDDVSYKFVLYGPGTGNTCNGTAVGTLIKSIDNVYDLAALFRANFATQLDDKVCHASQMTGANAGAKIVACLALLPTTGGTVDARGFEGSQTVSQDMFSGVTKPFTLLLGAATFHISTTQKLLNEKDVQIIGLNTGGQSVVATRTVWDGSNGGTMWFLDCTRDSLLQGFTMEPGTGTLAIPERIDQVSPSGSNLSTHNTTKWVTIGVSTTGVQIGNSSTSNNDLHVFDDVTITGSGTYCYYINQSQSKWIHIINGSCDSRTYGNYVSAGSFTSDHQNFSGNTTDVYLDSPTDTIVLNNPQSESANKFLDDSGLSATAWAVQIFGGRLDTNNVGGDNIYMRYRKRGPLTMIGVDFASGVHRAAPTWNITSTTVGASFLSMGNIYPNNTPFVAGSSFFGTMCSLGDNYVDATPAGQPLPMVCGPLGGAGATGTINVTGVTGISKTTVPANNLRGSCTFATAATCAVTFSTAETSNAYYVTTGANSAGTTEVFTVSSKGTGGFTVNSSWGTSTAIVDWMLVR